MRQDSCYVEYLLLAGAHDGEGINLTEQALTDALVSRWTQNIEWVREVTQ